MLGVSEPLRGAATNREDKGMSLEQKVQRLTDRLHINELMARYCRHADLLDAEGMAACFTDDCVVAYVPASIAAPARSKKELLGFLHAYFPNSVSSTHYITNVELLFDTPDRVTAHTYMYSWQRFKGYPVATGQCRPSPERRQLCRHSVGQPMISAMNSPLLTRGRSVASMWA